MNPTPPNNRLKDAVNNVPVPDDLVASVRSQIRAGLPPRSVESLEEQVFQAGFSSCRHSRFCRSIDRLPLRPFQADQRFAGRLYCFSLYPCRSAYEHWTEGPHPLLGLPQVPEEATYNRGTPPSNARRGRQGDIPAVCRANSDRQQPYARNLSDTVSTSVHL